MKIHEHCVGSIVRVYSSFNEQVYHETIVLEPIEKDPTEHLICRPIIENGKFASIQGASLIAEITKPDTGRVYKYKIEKQGFIQVKGNVYYVIVSREDANEFNRRGEYRVSFSNIGSIQVGPHSRVIDCHIKDISPRGVGLSIHRDTGFKGKPGDEVSIHFRHNKSDERYHVIGHIVRVEDSNINKNFITVGCAIDEKTQHWTNLVTKEQRVELKLKKGIRA